MMQISKMNTNRSRYELPPPRPAPIPNHYEQDQLSSQTKFKKSGKESPHHRIDVFQS